ncbi:MAG: DUF4145 domain-containing protein [Patescibacteria group bacterium]
MTLDTFLKKVLNDKSTRVDQAVAIVWFYQKFEFIEEISLSEIVKKLEELKYGKPNITNLRKSLPRKFILKNQKDICCINSKYSKEINRHFNGLLDIVEIDQSPSVFPQELFDNIDRSYIISILNQINTSYNIKNYDCVAVMVRRLMESLIIDIYILKGRSDEIRNGDSFMMLEKLITKFVSDKMVILSRSLPKNMLKIKDLGDRAAHDRNYITSILDINDNKTIFRVTINELLKLANIIS